MNRWNLIGLIATIAVTAALCGCASAPPAQPTTDTQRQAAKELGIARSVWTECVRVAIPRLNDSQSASEVVARAAMKGCSDQYTAMERALTLTLAPSCGRDPACARGALATAQREATQAATDEVMSARVRTAGAQVLQCE